MKANLSRILAIVFLCTVLGPRALSASQCQIFAAKRLKQIRGLVSHPLISAASRLGFPAEYLLPQKWKVIFPDALSDTDIRLHHRAQNSRFPGFAKEVVYMEALDATGASIARSDLYKGSSIGAPVMDAMEDLFKKLDLIFADRSSSRIQKFRVAHFHPGNGAHPTFSYGDLVWLYQFHATLEWMGLPDAEIDFSVISKVEEQAYKRTLNLRVKDLSFRDGDYTLDFAWFRYWSRVSQLPFPDAGFARYLDMDPDLL